MFNVTLNSTIMKPHPELSNFMQPYSIEIQQLAMQLRGFIVDLVPEANELIWDNYNAVALAYSKSEQLKDAFCHIAMYTNHINFGFNRGAQLTGHDVKLLGTGKLIRHIKVKRFKEFKTQEIAQLIKQAVIISETRNKGLEKATNTPRSIVMSVSAKKIRPE